MGLSSDPVEARDETSQAREAGKISGLAKTRSMALGLVTILFSLGDTCSR